jgi:ABC-type transport system involved in cytochrome bd biosynthesis fused ATPase/permease subunit
LWADLGSSKIISLITFAFLFVVVVAAAVLFFGVLPLFPFFFSIVLSF